VRIAVLSDIHGNLDALDAVLADLPAVDMRLCLGDFVGYYDRPNEVCERFREFDCICVRGNHDAYAIGEMQSKTDRDEHYRAGWTRDTLTPETLAWLKSLPMGLEFAWGGTRIAARHASPFDERTYVYPDFAERDRLFAAVEDILLLGHTHIPMRLENGGKLVINPGSVGQPRDYDPRASYAILDTESRKSEVRRVAYDSEALAARLRAQGWAESSLALLTRRK
jgi:putative phosphoesterase